MKLRNDLATLRRIRGWTQEELAERCGLSVRTVRNVERGWVEKPRRSSLELLVRALGSDEAQQSRPPAVAGSRHWRGPAPPESPIVGMRTELDELAHTVLASRLTTLLGAGGVGKTRIALGAAANVAASFRQGAAVVELGNLLADEPGAPPRTAELLARVRRLIHDVPSGPDAARTPLRAEQVLNMVLVLDNAEHLPATVADVTKELLSAYAGLHILVTSRRPLIERLGVSYEIRPLAFESGWEADPPAIELVLRRAGTGTPAAAALVRDIAAVTELCRRLDGIPRALEFAAERLRAIPIRSLLATGPALGMLRTSDHLLLPHQRSLAGSIGWSIGLLTEGHRALLRRIAGLPGDRFTLDDVLRVAGSDSEPADVICRFSDLAEHRLVTACRDRRYHYRLMTYVGEVAGADTHS